MEMTGTIMLIKKSISIWCSTVMGIGLTFRLPVEYGSPTWNSVGGLTTTATGAGPVTGGRGFHMNPGGTCPITLDDGFSTPTTAGSGFRDIPGDRLG